MATLGLQKVRFARTLLADSIPHLRNNQGQHLFKWLRNNHKVVNLEALQIMLAKLIRRCETSRNGKAEVVTKKGFPNLSFVQEDIPFLMSHFKTLSQVISEMKSASSILE